MPTAAPASDQSSVPLIDDFWSRVQAKRGLSDDELKAAVVKDQETIALVGALVMTITFAVHVNDDAVVDSTRGIRCAYLLATGCSSALALTGTVIAVRTVIMLNINKAEDAPHLLNYVERQRLNWRFFSFNFVKWSIFSLLVPQCILVYVNYDWLEVVSYMIPLFGALALCAREDSVQAFAFKNTRTAAEHTLAEAERS